MKVTVIWSTPNTDGLTAATKNSVIEGLKNNNAEVTEFHINKMNIAHCRACGNGFGICREKGCCILNDDFDKIHQEILSSDGVIFVSAVYWSDMTEQMKIFTDRLRRCETLSGRRLENKKCLIIACAGGSGNGTIECLTSMERLIKHMGMSAYDRIPVVRFNREYMLPAIEKAGEAFVKAFETNFR